MTRRTVFLLGVPGAAGCKRDRRPRLNVFNWSSYIASDTIPNFEREFGIDVRYGIYESNEEMLARVMTGNSGWDVVFPANNSIEPMRQQSLLARLDHSRLGNLRHLDPFFRKPPWDSTLDWHVPYMWGTTGICSARPMEAWADLWNPELQGRITMLDDPVDVFAACLKKLGHSLNTHNPDELRAAQKEALDQKEIVRAYVNAEIRDQLVSGDVVASQLWSITAQQAISQSAQLRYCHPREGFAMYTDCCAVLRESSRQELAHKFIDYLLRPDVAAKIADEAKTSTVNAGARLLLNEETPVLYPPADVLERGEWLLTASAETHRLRDRLWSEIKAS